MRYDKKYRKWEWEGDWSGNIQTRNAEGRMLDVLGALQLRRDCPKRDDWVRTNDLYLLQPQHERGVGKGRICGVVNKMVAKGWVESRTGSPRSKVRMKTHRENTQEHRITKLGTEALETKFDTQPREFFYPGKEGATGGTVPAATAIEQAIQYLIYVLASDKPPAARYAYRRMRVFRYNCEHWKKEYKSLEERTEYLKSKATHEGFLRGKAEGETGENFVAVKEACERRIKSMQAQHEEEIQRIKSENYKFAKETVLAEKARDQALARAKKSRADATEWRDRMKTFTECLKPLLLPELERVKARAEAAESKLEGLQSLMNGGRYVCNNMAFADGVEKSKTELAEIENDLVRDEKRREENY